MTEQTLKEELKEQIDKLPDDIVREIADYIYALMLKHNIPLPYSDWEEGEWQEFSIRQFFRDDDESLTDWEKLDAMVDKEIDTSDIPPLDDNFFANAKTRQALECAKKRSDLESFNTPKDLFNDLEI